MSMFADLPRGHFAVIAADPGTRFDCYSEKGESARTPQKKYTTLLDDEIAALPVGEFAAKDCHLFYWDTGARIVAGRHIPIMRAWGFEPSAIAFTWFKLRPREPSGAFFYPRSSFNFGPGKTTRKNTEICMLGRRGSPKRLSASVREEIFAPRREHSRKPDCVHERIERLVAGPYLELFARQSRPGWTTWGNEATKFDRPEASDDFAKSLDVAYSAIRERVANGGERGWMDEPAPDYESIPEFLRRDRPSVDGTAGADGATAQPVGA